MDVSLAPKLIAAALVGATATAVLPKAAPASNSVVLKLEWVQSDKSHHSESLILRAMLDRQTTYRQGNRVIDATPSIAEDGTVLVKLNVDDVGVETLSTQVHAVQGETTVIMGTTKRDGRATHERLLFLTVDPT